MEKDTPHDSRIKRYWENIKEIVPDAATVLTSAVSIAECLSKFGLP